MTATASKARQKLAGPPAGPDGATPVRAYTLAGVVRTTKGYALATCVVGLDGSMSVSLGGSQVFPEHVVTEHARAAQMLDLKVQAGK
jgi:hypothetical protein